MNAIHDTVRRPSAPTTAANPSDVHAASTPARRHHRPRDFGIGYGSSSGYGCTRRYSSLTNQHLFRCG